MKLFKITAVAFFSITSLITSLSVNANNRLEIDYYDNLSDSTWGIKNSWVFTDETGDFDAYRLAITNPNTVNSLRFLYYAKDFFSRSFTINFTTDGLGTIPLSVGFYDLVNLPPYNASFDFRDTGLSYSPLPASFQIFEIERGARLNVDGRYDSFVASFQMYGFDGVTPYIAGRIWYNSDYVIGAVPEPESLAMLFAGLGLLGIATRRNK